MEDVSAQTHITTMDKGSSVVLDMKSLSAQYPEKCCGSPKMSKVLSRKGSNRMERQNGEDLETDDASKKIVVKVICSQIDHLKQASIMNKSLVAVTASPNLSSLTDSGDGRKKRFIRLKTINPRNILFFFATMSSMGTMLLIYLTLVINRRGGV